MSGRRKTGLSPTLFPFLAVLICTLGTLILMLALLANQGNKASAASTTPAEKPQESVDKSAELAASQLMDERLREAIWHREQVVKMRDDQTADLEEQRIKQTHLEDHVARLRDELTRLEAEVKAAHEQDRNSSVRPEDIDEIRRKIDEEKAKIKSLEENQQNLAPRIVIVPHKGPNGTDRRPVYIECKYDRVVIHPEGVEIAPRYLEDIVPGANPLDAALRTIRLHAMQNYGDTVAPYPLIVVRPDGIETYAAVRAAMRDWDDQFGYELVPGDVKLAFPDADNELKERIEEVVAKAVVRQEAIAASFAGTNGQGNGGGQTSGGGTVPGRSGPAGSLVQRGATPTGASSTGSSSAGPMPGGAAFNGTGSVAVGSGAPGGYSGAAGSPDGRVPSSAFPVLSARDMDARSTSLKEGLMNPRGRAGGLSSAAMTGTKAPSGSAGGQADGEGLASEGQNDSLNPSSAEMMGSPSGTTGQRQDASATGTSSYAGISGAASGSAASPSAQGEVLRDGERNADDKAPLSSVAGRSAMPSGSSDPNAPLGGMHSSGSMDSTNAGGTPPPMTTPPDGAMTDQAQTMSPNVKMEMGKKPPTKSRGKMVNRAGNNWALPPDVASTIGTEMVRIIRVECHEDRLVLLPERGRGATNVYGFSDGGIDRASLEMATDIRDRVSRWGAAMPGARWQPVMEVNVAPGGEFRFQQLRRLMDGSGVRVESKGGAP